LVTEEQREGRAVVIEARGLTKVFLDFWHRPKVRAVSGLSFDVYRGEVFGLLGPNGSGKTTTLKMLLGLLYPTQGALRVLGHGPRHVLTKARIGYLPEDSYLYPSLTCEETLHFYGRLFGLPSRERGRRVEQLLEMIGLRHMRHRLVGEFSRGMARRLGLAQALINDPDLVIMDEPTAGLDPPGRRQVKDLILTLAARGKTVVISSHLLADMEDVCDRVAILYDGRFRAEGTVADLLEERRRVALTVPAPEEGELQQLREAVRAVTGVDPVVEHPRRNLEEFFLEVIEQARRETPEVSGALAERGLADYLAGGLQKDGGSREGQKSGDTARNG